MAEAKVCVLNHKASREARVDLMIFGCQENLPVPGISTPSGAIPAWNADTEYAMIQMATEFSEKHLHDHGAFVVFHSFCADSLNTIAGLIKYPIMEVLQGWMEMNQIHLTSAIPPVSTVLVF